MKIDTLTPNDWTHVDPTWLQRTLRRLLTRPGRWLMRYEAHGHLPRVPASGGFLLAPAPHGGFLDPFIFGLGQERTRLRFMAKSQALEWPVIGRVIRWGGGFPVVRGAGRSAAALDVARAVVDSGDGVVLFMEGRLELDHPGLGTPRDGLARLALLTGAPVVPVGAWGAKRARAYNVRWWLHRPKVTLVWGAPIQFDQRDSPTQTEIDEALDHIWDAVRACFERAQQQALQRHRPGRIAQKHIGNSTPARTQESI